MLAAQARALDFYQGFLSHAMRACGEAQDSSAERQPKKFGAKKSRGSRYRPIQRSQCSAPRAMLCDQRCAAGTKLGTVAELSARTGGPCSVPSPHAFRAVRA